MRYCTNQLTRAHLVVFVAMLAVFMVLTYGVTDAGLDEGPEHGIRVVQATLGTITGPLTGAISRGFQSCCLRFSLTVMAYCAPILLVGVATQFIGLYDRQWFRMTRMVLWILGWLVWFLGGLLSFGHALS